MAAFRRHRTFGMRRRRAPVAWIGGRVLDQTLAANTLAGFILWDASVSQITNVQGHGVHQRTLLDFRWSLGTSATKARWQWYLTWVNPGVGGSVAPTMWSPNTADFEDNQRPVLHWELNDVQLTSVATTQSAADLCCLHRDIKVKRRFDDTDMLVLVVESDVALDTSFSFRYRVLCSLEAARR